MKEKTKKKLKVYFSMSPDLHEIFEKHIDKNLLDKSKVIESLIDEYMKKK
jgi:hypothetical protein